MSLNDLKPTERHRVYDLVREAGLDVSDWANYRRPEHPASNPKYCYNWAFEGTDRVVLCLWFGEIQEDDTGVFQELNHREISSDSRNWTFSQRKRAAGMDHAFQLAKNKNLTIRVIVVDGSRRDDDERTASEVERRLLDPEPWFVESYDEDGTCVLRRGVSRGGGVRKLARLSYNKTGWRYPTGEAGESESGETFNARNRFGYEDWIFREEWRIDNWRYAFIQGVNKSGKRHVGELLDITLYTIDPSVGRRLVATINNLEVLSEAQATAAVAEFRRRGWFQKMRDEVRQAGGEPSVLDSTDWAPHILNVRFRMENVDFHPSDAHLPDSKWLRDRKRYLLYNFDEGERVRLEDSLRGRTGAQEAPDAPRFFRRGTKPVEYTPEHNLMQAQLLKELQAEYGQENVWLEKDYVDARVETEGVLIYFEIKTDLDPRAVIRQALGQVLEYAYHPGRSGRRPDQLVIVGRSRLRPEDEAYLTMLYEEFHIPLSYRTIKI